MKKLTLLLLCVSFGMTQAQDIFQQRLFTADHILKYKSEIELASEKEKEIKKIYNDHITKFNEVKWDLDAEMTKMSKLLAEEIIDIEASKDLMSSILEKEEELKKQRFETMVMLKNMLSKEQQEKLQNIKEIHGEYKDAFFTSVNENPRISLKVQGKADKEQPLIIVKNKKGLVIREGKDASDLSPDEIESINVLKGDSATELYGKDGENGVIVIVLKKKK